MDASSKKQRALVSFEPADISVSYRIAADRNFSEIAREDGELKLGQVGSAIRSTFTSDGILDKVSLFEVGARFVSFMGDLVHVLGLEDKVGRLLVDAGGGKGRASAKRIIAAELPMGYRRAAYTTITSEMLMTCEKYAASDNLFVPKGLTAPAGGLNSSHVSTADAELLEKAPQHFVESFGSFRVSSGGGAFDSKVDDDAVEHGPRAAVPTLSTAELQALRDSFLDSSGNGAGGGGSGKHGGGEKAKKKGNERHSSDWMIDCHLITYS
jgi:hypothetical protein